MTTDAARTIVDQWYDETETYRAYSLTEEELRDLADRFTALLRQREIEVRAEIWREAAEIVRTEIPVGGPSGPIPLVASCVRKVAEWMDKKAAEAIRRDSDAQEGGETLNGKSIRNEANRSRARCKG